MEVSPTIKGVALATPLRSYFSLGLWPAYLARITNIRVEDGVITVERNEGFRSVETSIPVDEVASVNNSNDLTGRAVTLVIESSGGQREKVRGLSPDDAEAVQEAIRS